MTRHSALLKTAKAQGGEAANASSPALLTQGASGTLSGSLGRIAERQKEEQKKREAQAQREEQAQRESARPNLVPTQRQILGLAKVEAEREAARPNLVPTQRQILGLPESKADQRSIDLAVGQWKDAHRADISEAKARELLGQAQSSMLEMLGAAPRYAPDMSGFKQTDEGARQYTLSRLSGAMKEISSWPETHENEYRKNARRIAGLEREIGDRKRRANEAVLRETDEGVRPEEAILDGVDELQKELDNRRAEGEIYKRLTKTEDEIKTVRARADFAANSSPEGIRNPEERYNDYVNDPDYQMGQAINASTNPLDALASSGSVEEGYHLQTWRGMTDEERAVWYYKVRTEGEKGADDFLKAMDIVVGKRTLDETADMAADSGGGKIGYSALSTLMSVGGAPFAFAKDLAGMATDSYNPYNADAFRQAQAMREGVSRDMGEGGKFLYNTGMSMLDSVLGAGTIGKPYSVIMGMGSASTEAKELWEQGASEGQILAGAGLSGVAEALFEEVSLDRLLSEKPIGNWREWITSLVKQGGVEASEEAFTELANIVSDTAVRGNTSDLVKLYDSYLEKYDGDAGQAFRSTVLDKANEVGLAAAGGFMSGFGMASVFDTVNFHNSDLARRENRIKSTGDAIGFVETLERELELARQRGEVSAEAENAVRAAQRRVSEKYNLDAYGRDLSPAPEGDQADSTAQTAEENKNAPGEGTDEFENIGSDSGYDRLRSESAYTNNNGGQVTKASDVQSAPDSTPEASLPSPVTANNSISESGEFVNSRGEESLPAGEAGVVGDGTATDEAQYRRAAEEYTAPDTPDAAATQRTGKAYGATSAQIAQAQEMSALFGKPILFGDPADARSVAGINAKYDRRDDMITLNPKSDRIVWRLCAAEMTHAIENVAGYESVRDFALANISRYDSAGRSYEQIFADKKRTYEAHEGRTLDDEYIRREMVEEFAGQYLFDDMQTIRQLVGSAPRGARRVMAWLDRVLMKHRVTSGLGRLIHSDLRQARENYAAAIREAGSLSGNKNVARDMDGAYRYSFTDSASGRANDALMPYDEELRSLIESNGGIIVDDYDTLRHVVDLAFDEPNLKSTVYFGIVGEDVLRKIALSVKNISEQNRAGLFKKGRDYSIAAPLDSIRHLTDEKNLSRADMLDYLNRLADTIIDPDSVTYSPYKRGNNVTNAMRFTKKFPDATYISYEFVSHNKRSLVMQTMYMEKGDYEKRKFVAALPVQNARGYTSETVGRSNFQDDYSTSEAELSSVSDDNVRHSLDDRGTADSELQRLDEAVTRMHDDMERDLNEGTKEQRSRKRRAEEKVASSRQARAEQPPAGYRGMSDSKQQAQLDNASGSLIRPDDAEARAELGERMADLTGTRSEEQNEAVRRKAQAKLKEIMARQAAQFFCEDNGISDEDIADIQKESGNDAAVLGALAAREIYDGTEHADAATVKRLAGEAKAISDARAFKEASREARSARWAETVGEGESEVTFEGDPKVIEWNKNHIDGMIKNVIDKNKLSREDTVLAEQIAAGERDASHIPNEEQKQKILLLADMYAARRALDNSTPQVSALRKLDVFIDSPMVSNYLGARAVIGLENARKELGKEISDFKKGVRHSVKDPVRAEKIFSAADTVADGVNTPESFSDLSESEKNKVWHLARMLQMKSYLTGLGVAEVKARNNERFDRVLSKILPDPTIADRKSSLVLNSTTPVRNNLSVFGEETGTKINDALFRPVVRNEGERINFVNREKQEFDTLFGELNKDERALLQFMVERGIGSENIKQADIRYELEAYLTGIDPTEGIEKKGQAKLGLGKNRAENRAAKYTKNAKKSWENDQKRVKNALSKISDKSLNNLARASDFLRGKYALYYEATNEFLVMHGYEPIPFRTGYAPHMQSEQVKKQFGTLAGRLGFGERVFELPTSIAGRTDTFKPGKHWNPNYQSRFGKATYMDAVMGYERYVQFMSEVLYHTDDIQKLRRFSEYLRTYFANDTVKEKIDDAYTKMRHGEMSAEDGQAQIDGALKDAATDTVLSDYVSALDDYTNIQAGKQTKFDRSIESMVGREALDRMNRVGNAFSRAAIVGNLTSALNQTVQLWTVGYECGYANLERAIADVANRKTGLNKKIGFDHLSTFIIGKKGEISLTKTLGEKATNVFQIPFELVDDLAARITVRAKYFQLVNEGTSSERAIELADEYADRVIGSRMKGAKPILFCQKNIITNLITRFQLEPANAWDHIIRDMPREIRSIQKKHGRASAVKAVVERLLKHLLSVFLINRLLDELYGQTPVMFDVVGYFYDSIAEGFGVSSATFTRKLLTRTFDSLGDFEVERAEDQLKDGILDDVPYASGLIAMFGQGDNSSRLPLPNFSKLGNVDEDVSSGLEQFKKAKNAEDYAGALGTMTNGIWYTVKGLVPLGNQINKTLTGAWANIRGGAYDSEGRLKYPQDAASFDGVTSILFGSGANDRAGDYYASGYPTLSDRGTAAYRELIATGMDHGDAFDYIRAAEALKGDKDEREKIDTADMDFFEAMKVNYFYKDSMSEEEKEAEEAMQTKLRKQIEFLDGSTDLTDEQREIIFRSACVSEKLSDAMRMMATEDAKVLYGTVRDVVTAKTGDGEPTKADIIAGSKLTQDGKAKLWYAVAAGKKQRTQFERYRDFGDEPEDIYTAFRSVDEAEDAAPKGEKASAGRRAIADSALCGESKYDMYYGTYSDTSPVPGVMDDLTSNGAKKEEVLRWMAAYEGAKGIGNDEYTAKLRKGYTAPSSAGSDTAAQMEALLATDMTARELEAVYMGMMVSSSSEEKRREQFEKLHDAGGNAVDFFEAYVAVSKATWRKRVSGAKSTAVKKAIDGVATSRRVRRVLYDIFDVAESVR